mmetsp:Transcript_76092/g.228381  ORF Transcript_76092/g.228381 Transcript_76092/m.228381 type:complete len:362 (-) Transcript_76092:2606-3691(-)
MPTASGHWANRSKSAITAGSNRAAKLDVKDENRASPEQRSGIIATSGSNGAGAPIISTRDAVAWARLMDARFISSITQFCRPCTADSLSLEHSAARLSKPQRIALQSASAGDAWLRVGLLAPRPLGSRSSTSRSTSSCSNRTPSLSSTPAPSLTTSWLAFACCANEVIITSARIICGSGGLALAATCAGADSSAGAGSRPAGADSAGRLPSPSAPTAIGAARDSAAGVGSSTSLVSLTATGRCVGRMGTSPTGIGPISSASQTGPPSNRRRRWHRSSAEGKKTSRPTCSAAMASDAVWSPTGEPTTGSFVGRPVQANLRSSCRTRRTSEGPGPISWSSAAAAAVASSTPSAQLSLVLSAWL